MARIQAAQRITSVVRSFCKESLIAETNLEFEPGTHLRVCFGFYHHHGIALEDGDVIHFGRGIFDLENATVELVTLQEFSQGKSISIILSPADFDAEEILARAKSKLGQAGYDLIENNCEHFVSWCRSGNLESSQINMTEAVARQSAAAIARPMIRRWAMKQTGKRLGVATLLAKGPTVAAGFADAVQVAAELVAHRSGQKKESSRRIGQHAGIASSAAIGWVLGGPVTAAAGVGFWAIGQLIADQSVETGKQVVRESLSAVRRSSKAKDAVVKI